MTNSLRLRTRRLAYKVSADLRESVDLFGNGFLNERKRDEDEEAEVNGAALAVVAALTLTAGVLAQQGGRERGFGGPPHGGPGRGGPRGFGGPLGPLTRGLNLTDAQKEQVSKLVAAFEESTKSLREQSHKAGGGPFAGLTEGAFDEAAIRSAEQARANAQVELEVAHARLMSQVYALLTDEQKATLAERRQQFEQRRRAHEQDEN